MYEKCTQQQQQQQQQHQQHTFYIVVIIQTLTNFAIEKTFYRKNQNDPTESSHHS